MLRDWSRRDFFTRMAAAAALLAWPGGLGAGERGADRLLPLRRLGRAETRVTALCVGGAHVGAFMGEREAAVFLEKAVEVGCLFFDTAESYSGGESERRLGRFLPAARRKEFFLMTKTRAADRETAERHLEESLARMRVDYLDLWQMHDLTSAEDVDRRIRGGVVDFMLEAKAAGRVRYLGFTGHTRPSALAHMLKRLSGMGVEWDAVQMPVNVVDPHYESFVGLLMEPLVARGYAVLAMKTLVYGQLVGQRTSWRRDRRAEDVNAVGTALTLAEAFNFVWSLPVTSLVSGMTNLGELEENASLCRQFRPLDEAARSVLVERMARFAGPQMEFYKAG